MALQRRLDVVPRVEVESAELALDIIRQVAEEVRLVCSQSVELADVGGLPGEVFLARSAPRLWVYVPRVTCGPSSSYDSVGPMATRTFAQEHPGVDRRTAFLLRHPRRQ